MFPATLAWQMSVTASGYAALVLGGNATAIGLVSSAQGIPLLTLSLIGGVVADRYPRRSVLLATQALFLLSSAAVAVLSFNGLLQVWHLVALGLAQGLGFAFQVPARQAYIAELVGPRYVRNAVALNDAGMNFSRVAGPAVAGTLLAIPAVGVGGVFGIMTALYGGVLASLLRLPSRPPPGGGARSKGGLEDLLEGLRYIRASPPLLTLLGIAVITIFFGLPYQQLMPLFAERVFEVGPVGLGMLSAANGVGALLGAVMVAALSQMRRPALLQAGLGVLFGLGLAGFAQAPSLPLGMAVLLVVGFSSAGFNALNNTLVMGNTEPRLYGRVMSVYLVTFALMPLGALPMAFFADQVGARTAITLAGLIVLLVSGFSGLLKPFRRLR
jgi:MFS family permease